MSEQLKHQRYEDSKLYRIRHSAAHVMAQAVLQMFPEAKIAIGPAIEDGFYYDFDLPRPLTPEDLAEIEQRMRKIIRGGHAFHCKVVSQAEARELFKDQPYKLELIDGLEQGGLNENGEEGASVPAEKPVLSVYQHDSFVDLCRGPHVERTDEIDPQGIKLMSVAGAYWRGDEHRPMLQRIYGTAWPSKEALDAYLWRLEEAKKRDHRKLGRELGLFSIEDDIGGGLVLWHPKGGMLRKMIEDFWNEQHVEADYDFVYSPHIAREKLWKTSGHLDFYRENMYAPLEIEGQQFYLKPVNCPYHVYIYKSHLRSYRELPLRFAERGTVYRYEQSGVLHGLLRVRGFTQDDAHHFCTAEQMPDEIDFVLRFSLNMLRAFGFNEIKAFLSTRPEKAMGNPQQWADAELALEQALKRDGIAYGIDEGGGAFYGPKIDIKVSDALGREWQLSTIQFDFNLPERFDVSYIGEDGQPHRPYMVHRALLGSLERFFGVLIEHYGGSFPVWLAPVQVAVIPIADRHVDFAKEVGKRLKKAGLRAEVDDGAERMQAKIRGAQTQKIPYMLVIGDKEVEQGAVALRLRSGGRLENGEYPGPMPVDAFINMAVEQARRRSNDVV